MTVRPTSTGERAAAKGAPEQVTYEVTVRNRTGQRYPEAEIVQMLAGGTETLHYEPDAILDQEWLVWPADLAGKQRMTVRSTVLVPPSDNADIPRSGTAVCVRPYPGAGFSGCGADGAPVAAPGPQQP
ncbi:hypothetical protein P8605_50135, partial [Streptomyces sp. T-3]|nr:hypothetical protein [Streptomyces sp. T-3]